MDLVDEEDGPLRLTGAGFRHDAPQVGDAGGDGREHDKVGLGHRGDDARETGLPSTGWAPEDHGRQLARFYQPPQDLPGTDKVLLTDVFVQRAGSHTGGEGCAGAGFSKRAVFGKQ
jgi:hypothetical protein